MRLSAARSPIDLLSDFVREVAMRASSLALKNSVCLLALMAGGAAASIGTASPAQAFICANIGAGGTGTDHGSAASVACGSSANAGADPGNEAVAIGNAAHAANVAGIAIGAQSSTATGIALGAQSSSNSGISIGGSALSNGASQIAIGTLSTVTGPASAALGYGTRRRTFIASFLARNRKTRRQIPAL
jgi:hypothetical protein